MSIWNKIIKAKSKPMKFGVGEGLPVQQAQRAKTFISQIPETKYVPKLQKPSSVVERTKQIFRATTPYGFTSAVPDVLGGDLDSARAKMELPIGGKWSQDKSKKQLQVHAEIFEGAKL